MLVFFKSGVVALAHGEQKGGIETIEGSENLKVYLNALGFQELRRVVPDFSPDDTIAITDDGITVKIPDYSRLFKIIVSESTDIQKVCDSLNSFVEVINAEPNYILQVDATPNDPKFPQQWNLDQSSDYDIDMKQGWDIEKGNYDIKIGILDMGVQYQHEDFGNGFGSGYKVKGGWDYIDNDPYPDGHYGSADFPHGNHVAGIAGALTHNNKGVAGIAGGWSGSDLGCALYAYEIGGACGVYLDYAISAILRASKPTYQGGDGVQILNNSWGGYEWIEEERKAVIAAYKYGRTFVAAKGNDNTSFHHLPSDYDPHCVISVGATDNFDNRWYDPSTGNGSNYGNGIDVVAPGWEIWSTAREPSDYCDTSGTSMSAPHVSGLAGLIWSRAYEKGISLQPEDIEGIIRATAEDKGPPGYDDEYGAGRINAYDALRYFDYPQSIRRYTVTPTSGITVGFYIRKLIGIPGLPDGDYRVMVNEYRSDFDLPTDIIQFLDSWGLGRLTTGYSNANPNYGEGYCIIEKLPNGKYRAKTYVYHVSQLDWSPVGWFPCNPDDVKLCYSLFSVNITAPFNLHPTNVTETSLILDWSYNYPDLIDGFTVKKDGLVIGNPGSGQTQWPVTGLEPGHMYHFDVLARKGSVYSAPAVLDAGTIPTGAIAQSGYSKMSAFNNGAKVARYGNNVYVVHASGDWGNRHVYCLHSTDGGISFAPYELHRVDYEAYYKSQPSIAVSSGGIPYVVWGTIYWTMAGVFGIEEWQRCYHCAYYTNNTWQIVSIYGEGISDDPNWTPTEDYIGAPSIVLTADSGYVIFKYPNEGDIHVIRFLLSNPGSGQYASAIPNTSNVLYYPAIGYDNGGRLVVLVHNYAGPLTLYWRTIGSNNWEFVPLSDNYIAYGSPSLWPRQNELRISFEGWNDNTCEEGLFFLRIPWQNNAYDVNQPIELVSSNFDYDSWGIEGYSYFAGMDVVLWKYDNDIWYSRRMGGVWTPKTNISATTGNISSYPQGIIYGSLTTTKLFALWTEQVGNQYYLVRKAINLPYAYPVYAIGESDIPEATGYNNARRFLKDANDILHLAFTSGDNVYHTFLQDSVWSEPVLIGEGKYPALSLTSDGKLYYTWSFHGYKKFGGWMYYVEYLYLSSYDGTGWSEPGILFHTYGTFLWGVGAPSLAINDTMAHVAFKSYHGPHPNPAPGTQPPHIVVVEGPALIYGIFPLNNPEFSYTILDTIIKDQTSVDTLTYRDSLVPLLISPSVTVDMAGIPHILWEGDSTVMRYYTITDTGVTKDTFDIGVDFPHLAMNGDKIDLFWTTNDSIRYRYGWTGTANLSQTQTIAECESPFSSSQNLTWTNSPNGVANGGLSHLYYGAIPASGAIEPIELNYSTDRILFPQIVFNSAKSNFSPSLDFVWTEYSELDSLGYIYYLNLALTKAAPKYAFDMGTETPVPVCLQRDGYLAYGIEDYQTVDYDSSELVYHLTLHDSYGTKVPTPKEKYKIRWTYYHQEPEKIKLGFSLDDILHHNRWVEPNEKVVEETWIPRACLDDNAITIRITRLNGTIAVLSGMEIEEQEVGAGGGPQGNESQLAKPFLFETMYPNPANKVLKIRFNSPDERKVSIKIYDVAGRLAQLVFEGNARAGMNEYLIKPKDFAAGIYFVCVEAAGYEKTQKIILLRDKS